MTEKRSEITRLLRAWRDSDEVQEELWALLYQELKGLARNILRDRGGSARKRTTSLVHKAYLRLLGADVDWTDRRHFFAVAARAMRFVLADEARRQLAQKRGAGEVIPLGLTEVSDPFLHRPEEVLAVHEALERLAKVHPRHEQVVELRYFAGLSVEETAEILDVTPRTIVRDWRAVKAWLHGELGQTSGGSSK